MANTVQQSGRAGAGGRRWRAATRANFLTFLIAAMLCYASYCVGIWHNNRGAADSRVLGLSAAVAGGASSCGGNGSRAADADEPLDFEAHHAAESAGLSVSASPAATRTTSVRRALRGNWTAPATRAVARAGNPVPGADAAGGGGNR